jgi:hypothetical protein
MTTAPEERYGHQPQQPREVSKPISEWYALDGRLIPEDKSIKLPKPLFLQGNYRISDGRSDDGSVICGLFDKKMCSLEDVIMTSDKLRFAVRPADASGFVGERPKFVLNREGNGSLTVQLWDGDCEYAGKRYHVFCKITPVKKEY